MTKPEAGIPNTKPIHGECLIRVTMITAFFLMVIIAVVVNKRGSVCVELPNGLLIAGAPNPRPHNFRGGTIFILKKPDGTVIVPAPSQTLNITQTTVYGRAGPTVESKALYSFTYRPDTGLVLEKINLKHTLELSKKQARKSFWARNRIGFPAIMLIQAALIIQNTGAQIARPMFFHNPDQIQLALF